MTTQELIDKAAEDIYLAAFVRRRGEARDDEVLIAAASDQIRESVGRLLVEVDRPRLLRESA